MPAPTRPRSAPPRATWPAPALSLRVLVEIAEAIVTRPALWGVALRQCRRLVPVHWWRRRPYLPVPPRSYLGFRFATAYGGSQTDLPDDIAADVVSYLQWCRSMPGTHGVGRRG